MLQASHDLHLVGCKQAGPTSPSPRFPPEATTDSSKDGGAFKPPGSHLPAAVLFAWAAPTPSGVLAPLALLADSFSSSSVGLSDTSSRSPLPPTPSQWRRAGQVLGVWWRGCSRPLTHLLEERPLGLLIEADQLLHHHHLACLPVCHLRGDAQGLRLSTGTCSALGPPCRRPSPTPGGRTDGFKPFADFSWDAPGPRGAGT